MPSKKNVPIILNTVNLTGNLTISRAVEILSLLNDSLESNDNVRIVLREVSNIDLSCLQLLCSAHRTAAAAGKELTLKTPLPDIFLQLIRQTGFNRQKGCVLSPNTNCLCFDGGE